MPKEMEGDNRERRRRAKDARDAGTLPSAEGVTTGASKQRRHLDHDTPHEERIAAKAAGKQDPEHVLPQARPGSRPGEPPREGVVVPRSVDLDRRRVGYLEAGVGDQPIVLLHGFPLPAASWEYQFEGFNDDYRAIAPDLMGFGRSQPVDDPTAYSIEGFADDVAGVIADAGVERAPVVGVGLGGHVAFNLLRRHAELVAALVLADVRHDGDTPEERRRRDEQIAWLVGGGDVESLIPHWLRFVAGATWSRRAEVVKKARAWITETPRSALVGALDATNRRPDIAQPRQGGRPRPRCGRDRERPRPARLGGGRGTRDAGRSRRAGRRWPRVREPRESG